MNELPAKAKASSGRSAAPTQFDNAPLKVGQFYEIPGLTSEEEKEVMAELRRWAAKQPAVQGRKLNVRVAGRDPAAALGNEKRTIYVEAYVPAVRGPRTPVAAS